MRVCGQTSKVQVAAGGQYLWVTWECSHHAPACCARKVAEQRTLSSYESRIPPSFAAKLMQALTPSSASAFCRIQFKIAAHCPGSRGGILDLNYGLDYRRWSTPFFCVIVPVWSCSVTRSLYIFSKQADKCRFSYPPLTRHTK